MCILRIVPPPQPRLDSMQLSGFIAIKTLALTVTFQFP